MKILIDCDVLLDVALGREPHLAASGKVLDWAQGHPGKAAVAWHTISNLFYLTGGKTSEFIEAFSEFIDVPTTGSEALRYALSLDFKDFEDAMQVAAADAHSAQCIVTRNLRHYKMSPIKAISPGEFVILVKAPSA